MVHSREQVSPAFRGLFSPRQSQKRRVGMTLRSETRTWGSPPHLGYDLENGVRPRKGRLYWEEKGKGGSSHRRLSERMGAYVAGSFSLPTV